MVMLLHTIVAPRQLVANWHDPMLFPPFMALKNHPMFSNLRLESHFFVAKLDREIRTGGPQEFLLEKHMESACGRLPLSTADPDIPIFDS